MNLRLLNYCFSCISPLPLVPGLIFQNWGTLCGEWQLGLSLPAQSPRWCLSQSVSAQLYLTLWDPLDCSSTRLLCPWNFSRQNTRVGCHSYYRESSWHRDWTWSFESPALADRFFTYCVTWDAWMMSTTHCYTIAALLYGDVDKASHGELLRVFLDLLFITRANQNQP